MSGRASTFVFVLAEAAVLLAVVGPVAHIRSLSERVLLDDVSHLPEMSPDEPTFIVLRSLLAVCALQIAFGFRDLYRWSVVVRPQLVVVRLVESVIAFLVGLPLLHSLLGVIDRELELDGVLLRLSIDVRLVMACAGTAFLAAYGLRMRWPRWIRGAGLAERVAIVGHGPMIDVLQEEVRRRHDPGLHLVGFLDDAAPGSERELLGGLADVEDVGARLGVQRVVLSGDDVLPSETLLALRLAGTHITDTHSFYERLTGRVSPESLSHPELFLAASRSNVLSRGAKRLVDVLGASLGLAVASPLFAVVAVLIKLESPGPVFYRQERVGLNGRRFMLAKFRSMRADAETSSGPVWAQAADPRITRVGRWLRKLRIDEIPQLWSVLRNDMSLVGPRPERPYFVGELEQAIPHYGRRHLVKPGVTGWAQINYSYGNTVDDAFIKLQYDLYYIKHRSLALDIAILLRTVKVVVLQEGAV